MGQGYKDHLENDAKIIDEKNADVWMKIDA